VKEALVRLGGMLPMNIFLRQEIDRMQKILTLVRRTLSDLKGQSHQCLFFIFFLEHLEFYFIWRGKCSGNISIRINQKTHPPFPDYQWRDHLFPSQKPVL
jgi:hypothetical protein